MPIRMEEAQLAGSCICFVIELKGLTHSPPLCLPPLRAHEEHNISQIQTGCWECLPAPSPRCARCPENRQKGAGGGHHHPVMTRASTARAESTNWGAFSTPPYPVHFPPSSSLRLDHAMCTLCPPLRGQRTHIFSMFKEICSSPACPTLCNRTGCITGTGLLLHRVGKTGNTTQVTGWIFDALVGRKKV